MASHESAISCSVVSFCAEEHIKIGGKDSAVKDGKIDWHDVIAAEQQNKDSAIYSECNSFEELNLYVCLPSVACVCICVCGCGGWGR